jgi:sec-independent protein translocase protein TatC
MTQSDLPENPSALAVLPARAVNAARHAVRNPFRPIKKLNPLAPLPEDESEEPEVFEEMTLVEHLEELRSRIFRICVSLGVAFVAGLILATPALHLILRQTHINRFQINDATENITDFFKMAAYIAILISLPMIAYQAFSFISPGLTRKEKRIVYSSIPFVILLFLAGASFAFFFAIPRAFKFLSTFQSQAFDFQPTFSSVASFYAQVTIGLGLAFELPVVMFLLARIGIVSPQRMRGVRRYAAVLILIAAAIITPTPDPFNMMIVAIPIYSLFELGLVAARVGARKRIRPEAA